MNIPEIAKQYAKAYSTDSGDNYIDYAERVAWDVFPYLVSSATVNGERRELKRLVIREIERRK